MSNKKSLASVIPRPPKIRRAILRKYSWLPDVLRIEGSIITRILGPVLTVTVFAGIVGYLSSIGKDVHLTNSVIPVVAVVVGLILVFRNTTSYDRYWEGRKSFATMNTHIRNLTRLIWINVSIPPADAPVTNARGKAPANDLSPHLLHKRKVKVIKLCLSFAYATKHYLRGEDGLDYPDYDRVLPASFRRSGVLEFASHGVSRRDSLGASFSAAENGSGSGSSSSVRSSSPDRADATKRVRPKRSNPNIAANAKTPLLGSSGHATITFEPESASMPLPLIIAHEISRAIFTFKRDGLLETVGPAGTNSLNTLVQGMTDAMTSMERIANTPIPRSYRIHLKQAVTLYLFALPFTMIKELGWGMVPVVTLVAFTFMGIEGIADECEMPFGKDASDLPLDRYCADLKEEIEYLIERLPEGGEGMYGIDDGEGDD